MPQHTVVIEKLVSGGLGLGRLENGKIILSPLVLPGEEVLLEELRNRKNFIEALPVAIISPSPQRIEPACPVFGSCGGCDLQHMAYPDQLAFKQLVLQEHISQSVPGIGPRQAGPLPRQWLHSAEQSPRQHGYRQRIRLQVNSAGQFGFFRRQTHQVQPIVHCLLARREINDALDQLTAQPLFLKLLRQTNMLDVLLSLQENKIVLIFHLTRKARPLDHNHARSLGETLPVISGILLQAPGHGMVNPMASAKNGTSASPMLHFELGKRTENPLTMTCEAGGFTQVNPEQNDKMISRLLDWCAMSGQERVLDLFCGMGNFSLPLAQKARQLSGIDQQRAAVRSAQRNSEVNGLTNCAFEPAAAAEKIRFLAESHEQFDIVLIDPPRQGCWEVIPWLEKLEPQKIIYISCDPATLSRDLTVLVKKFTIREIQLFDMFPQTHHMETMVLLEKSAL